MAVLISDKNDDLIRGHRAKINIIYDDLINYKDIEKFINEYWKSFDLEKKEKIE